MNSNKIWLNVYIQILKNKIVRNQSTTLGEQFPEFFANLIPTKVLVGASGSEVVRKQACIKGKHNAVKLQKSKVETCTICGHKGSSKSGEFLTFVEQNKLKQEINKRKDIARAQAPEFLKLARSISNVDGQGNLVSYEGTDSMHNFVKQNKIATKFRYNNQTFEQVTDGTKFIYPMATHDELVALAKGKPLPEFSLLQ